MQKSVTPVTTCYALAEYALELHTILSNLRTEVTNDHMEKR